jgi:hypothetical protein
MKRKNPKDVVKIAENALRELELNADTNAAKTRFARVWAGLRALDDEQARLKDQQATIDRMRAALKLHGETPPTWGECVCDEIDKADRPCVVCEARADWYEDRGLPIEERTPGGSLRRIPIVDVEAQRKRR